MAAICAGAVGNSEAAARRAGYEAAIAAHPGLMPRVVQGDFFEESGVAAAEAILADRRGADAIFAANDMMAIGALMTLRRAGVATPGDIAVAGFDDIPLARLISPALTTMRVDIAGMGARAVARLAEMIGGSTDDAVEALRPQLVVRETA